MTARPPWMRAVVAALQPVLPAGAGMHAATVAAVGALLGIAVAALVAGRYGAATPLAMLAAPIGASAVLVFVVPASPFAQPWSVVGGSAVPAVVGLMVVHLLGSGPAQAGLAVGLGIVAMAALRCLHPPGGSYALLPVLAGSGSAAAGWSFPLVPVATNSIVLVLCGVLYHRLSGHPYPHRAPAAPPAGIRHEDIDAALHELGETLDVSRDDLELLLAAAERHAEARRRKR